MSFTRALRKTNRPSRIETRGLQESQRKWRGFYVTEPVAKTGARDGARTRDLRRDRPEESIEKPSRVPTLLASEAPSLSPLVGTLDVYPTDSGEYEVGLDGPAFPSRRFAGQIAAQESR